MYCLPLLQVNSGGYISLSQFQIFDSLKNGDVAVRLDRIMEKGGAITVTATKNNVAFALKRSNWVTSGNIPVHDTGKSSISFKVHNL